MASSPTTPTQSPTALLNQWSNDIAQYSELSSEINQATSLSEEQSYLSQLQTLYQNMTSTGDQLLGLTGSNAVSPTGQSNITNSLKNISTFLGTYNAIATVQNNFNQASTAYSSSQYSQTITSLIQTLASVQTNAAVLGSSLVSQYTGELQQSFQNVFNSYYQQQIQYAQEMMQTYNCPAAIETLNNMQSVINQAMTSGISPSSNNLLSQVISYINNEINYINDNPNLCSQSGVYTQESNAYESSNPYTGVIQQAVASGSPIQYIEGVLSELMQSGDVSQAQALLSDSYTLFRQEGQSNLYNQLMGVI